LVGSPNIRAFRNAQAKLLGNHRAVGPVPGIWQRCSATVLAATSALTLTAGGLFLVATPAAARVKPVPSATHAKPSPSATHAKPKPLPTLVVKVAVDAETLTPAELSRQIEAADALRADLMRSGADVAATNARLERLSAQANTLLTNIAAARTAQVEAETVAAAEKARLVALGIQTRQAQDQLGHLASDAYVRSGGPLGDMAAMLGALTAPSPDENTDSLSTMQYLVGSRARLFSRLESLRAEQVLTSARAQAATLKAAAAAKVAVEAKATLDGVIVIQRAALAGFQGANAAQVARSAGVRGALLRSEDPAARAADRRLAQALGGQDFRLLLDTSVSCGRTTGSYANGRLPASALCPLYAAPGESLARQSSIGFNAMSNAYQRETGSPLCVTDAYRSYAEQVAVKRARPGLAATPGRSQHGLGLALDLCGGVQNFASPAHLWMKRHAPLYGWFHPAWAEPSGSMPEPWHWEFAG
jgi:D-alanyl-D-alanine carboxypeptidase